MPPSEFVVKTVYWFFLYGCIGWGVEVVYAAIKEHKLVNKDGLPEKAQEIVDSLKFHFNTHIEVKDSIGKRYRRQDAIGTPFCVTVDGDTLTEGTVTLRYRDSMKQERVPVEKLREIIEDRVSITSLLKKLQ